MIYVINSGEDGWESAVAHAHDELKWRHLSRDACVQPLYNESV